MKKTPLIALATVGLLCVQVNANAAVAIYDDKFDFLSETSATAADPLPNISGAIPPGDNTATLTVGDLTFSISSPSEKFYSGSSWTSQIAGNSIAIGGDAENLNVDFSVDLYSVGFEFVEPTDSSSFIDSTFSVRLFNEGLLLDSFSFNAVNDTAAFVGVWADALFDRIEIEEITGGGENTAVPLTRPSA